MDADLRQAFATRLNPTSEMAVDTSMGADFSLSAKKNQAIYFAPNEWRLNHHLQMTQNQPFKDIGERISLALIDAGYTKDRHKDLTEVLKKLFGVSSATISDWRHGKKCPTMKNALDIAVKLNVCVEWILTGRGPKQPGVPDEDGDGTHLDISLLPPGQQVHLRALVHSIQEQGLSYKNQVNHDD